MTKPKFPRLTNSVEVDTFYFKWDTLADILVNVQLLIKEHGPLCTVVEYGCANSDEKYFAVMKNVPETDMEYLARMARVDIDASASEIRERLELTRLANKYGVKIND